MPPEISSDAVDSALPLIFRWQQSATNHVEILPGTNRRDCEEALQWLELTAKTPLGAVALHTGGILVHHGWLHSLPVSPIHQLQCMWAEAEAGVPLGCILIADDIIGGFFALNGGRLSEERGTIAKVFYLSPDTLEWECTGMGYGAFLQWAFLGNIPEFYALYPFEPPVDCPDLAADEALTADVQWWREVEGLAATLSFRFSPPLWETAGGAVIDRARFSVPAAELFELMLSLSCTL
eukprot:GGOE01021006.1.p1 GENE.GGOE01021006.1~~GGOE01021006.1.p1  ORF type:complete len:237 (-),score=48.52 GGOE01021006.1:165-875(-)